MHINKNEMCSVKIRLIFDDGEGGVDKNSMYGHFKYFSLW